MTMWFRAIVAALFLGLAVPAAAQSVDPSWSPALARKCTASDAVACWNLGASLQAGRGTAKDPAKAFAAFSRACDLSVGEACFLAGLTRTNGAPGVPINLAAAVTLLKQGCEAGLGEACKSAGVRYEQGRGVAVDIVMANAFYERACALRDGKVCHYLGQLWASGTKPAGRVDGRRAMLFASKGCDVGYAESCGLASWLAEGNLGAARDAATAHRYATMGCDFNFYGGCQQLGYAAAGRNDWTAARRWYDRACTLGGGAANCKARNDIDAYLSDRAKASAERARWDAAQAAGAVEVGRYLSAARYADAMAKAVEDMGSSEQASRVLVAARAAGQLDQIREIYFIAFEQKWPDLTAEAKGIVRNEHARRAQAAREAARARMVAQSSGSSGGSWGWAAPSSSSASTPTYTSTPTISESEIYRNARESVRSSYCNAGWGCR